MTIALIHRYIRTIRTKSVKFTMDPRTELESVLILVITAIIYLKTILSRNDREHLAMEDVRPVHPVPTTPTTLEPSTISFTSFRIVQ